MAKSGIHYRPDRLRLVISERRVRNGPLPARREESPGPPLPRGARRVEGFGRRREEAWHYELAGTRFSSAVNPPLGTLLWGPCESSPASGVITELN